MRHRYASWLLAGMAVTPLLPISLADIHTSPPPGAAPRSYKAKPSRYMPHQNARECARRVRQMRKAEGR